jgi:predicted metal-dependent RNase
MLEGGPVIDYFKRLAGDKLNTIIFVSYQIDGTMGSRVQKGLADVPMINSNGKMEVMKVEMQVETVRGFSGHSDRRQLVSYIQRVKPKPERIIVLHGEKSKCLSMANLFKRKYNVESLVPDVLETIKLR